MAKQTINIGTTANDGTGDPLRTAFDKVNSNFTELYNDDAGDVNSIIAGDGISVDTATGNVTVTNTITNNNQLTNGAGYVDGSGTTNRLPKFTDADTIGNSTITDTGTKIGVNNANPTYSLDVYRNEATNILRLQNNTFSSWFGSDASGFSIETNLFKPIVFKPSGVTAMTLDSSGNVTVNNNLSIGGTLIDSNSSSGTSGQILSSTGTGTDWVSLSEISGVDGTGTANYIPKWTDGDTIGNSVIYDDGTNVGIGTTSTSSFASNGNQLVVGSGSASQGITIYSNTTGTGNLLFADGTSGSDIYRGIIGYNHNNDSFDIYTNAQLAATIDSSGNVNIGTTTNQNYSNLKTLSISGALGSVLDFQSAAVGSGNNRVGQIYGGDGGFLSFATGDNDAVLESMRITSAGNVGINTSSPVVKFNINTGVARTLDTKTYTTFTQSSDSDDFRFGLATALKGGTGFADRYVSLEAIGYQVSNNTFSGGYPLAINPIGGNVGIGTSSPSANLQIGDYTGASRQIALASSTTGFCDILFGDGAASNSSYRGVVRYDHTGENMQFWTASTERMRIDSAGNVGINTSSPAALQEIFLTTAGKALRLNTNFANGNPVDLNPYVTGLNNGGFEIRINDAPKLVIWTNDDLHVDGDVIAYSTTISDQRLKDDVQTIDNALDKVSNLRGVSYTWNNGNRKGQKDLGLIAQEVEKVLPELVREKEMPMIDGGTYKTVDYEKIVGVLIEAVKELKAEIEILKSK